MFLLFFQILRSLVSYFVLVTIIIFDLALHISIYHPCGVFLAGYDLFVGKVLYIITQSHVYHTLFTDGTTDYAAAVDFDGIDLILL